jgi:hypothetical protein
LADRSIVALTPLRTSGCWSFGLGVTVPASGKRSGTAFREFGAGRRRDSWNFDRAYLFFFHRLVQSLQGPSKAHSKAQPIDAATVMSAANDMLSRVSLADLVRTLDLYHDERKQLPVEDVVEEMRKQIQLKDRDGGWLLSFTYGDNVKAQRVTGELVSRLIDAVASQRSTAVAQTEEFLEAMAASAGQEMEKAQTALREVRQNGGPTERLELDAGQARRHYESWRDKRAEAHLRRRIEERRQGPMLQLLDPGWMPAERFARQFAPWSIVLGAVGGFAGGGAGRLLQRLALCLVARRRPATAL